ncbi:MAG TPA: DUF4861 domain-containing protein [Verrucomicrobia bacterium]|nr:DUF4861 domain-containing protein [Verrucomicrobiota bacterium]HOB31533.1 DUF4861 family protein [Verrucomicrobiota bacterium]HOP97002.1 DUF4861 family protein [Verrucomicrobiota bacterium]
MSKAYLLSLGLVVALPGFSLAATELTVKAVNPLPFARPSQTLELTAEQLAPLGRELARVHVRDASGRELLCQAVDSDGDYVHDRVIFQADFAANEEKTFTAVLGERWVYTPDQFRAYGRFVRERFDDFAWENDRIAHRTYGQALETWQNEPLTSSTIDIWSKRTPRMVINEWYMADDYHVDHGEGADFYSAGLSRGCGGNGLWAADQLWVSRNFRHSRVLANGPIRVLFELTYEPFNVNGISVAEVKRISLDAGQHLDRFESRYVPYTRPGQPVTLTMAAGLKKVSGEQREQNTERGWIAKWERMEKNAGNQGLALVANPGDFQSLAEDRLNWLMISKVSAENVGVYWAGFCWDKAGQFTSLDAWKKYVDEFSQGLRSPIQLTVSSR